MINYRSDKIDKEKLADIKKSIKSAMRANKTSWNPCIQKDERLTSKEKKWTDNLTMQKLVTIALKKDPKIIFKTLQKKEWIRHETNGLWGHTGLNWNTPNEFQEIFAIEKAKKTIKKIGKKYENFFPNEKYHLAQLQWLSSTEKNQKKNPINKYLGRYGLDIIFMPKKLSQASSDLSAKCLFHLPSFKEANKMGWLTNGLYFSTDPRPCPQEFKDILLEQLHSLTEDMSKIDTLRNKEQSREKIVKFFNVLRGYGILNTATGAFDKRKIDESFAEKIEGGMNALSKNILAPAAYKLACDIGLVNKNRLQRLSIVKKEVSSQTTHQPQPKIYGGNNKSVIQPPPVNQYENNQTRLLPNMESQLTYNR